MSDNPPACYRCSRHIYDHPNDSCDSHIWPGTLAAAGLDLDRAVADLWHEVSAPLRRLVAWIERKITAATHRSPT